jgi:hypothetical protein
MKTIIQIIFPFKKDKKKAIPIIKYLFIILYIKKISLLNLKRKKKKKK